MVVLYLCLFLLSNYMVLFISSKYVASYLHLESLLYNKLYDMCTTVSVIILTVCFYHFVFPVGPPYTFRLKIKFYPSEPNNLHEELTRYVFFMNSMYKLCNV